MQSIFRYSPQRYSDSLMALGNVRIGTLYDFRRSEHRAGIADPQEGKKSVVHHISKWTDKDVGSIDHKALAEFRFANFEGSTNVNVENVTMEQHFDLPDCYIHCTSLEYSNEAMTSLDGADSCVKIIAVNSFYRRLTATLSLHAPVRFAGLQAVKYRERVERWNGVDWGDHPALIKELDFKTQVEIRAIWLPLRKGAISPIVINDCELIKFCELIDTPK